MLGSNNMLAVVNFPRDQAGLLSVGNIGTGPFPTRIVGAVVQPFIFPPRTRKNWESNLVRAQAQAKDLYTF